MVSCGTQTEAVLLSPAAGAQIPTIDTQVTVTNIQVPTQTADETKKATTLRLKAKQSIRNLFQKTNAPSTESLFTTAEASKRASLASSGKALAKRISKNFSRTSLPDDTPAIPQSELDNLQALTQRRAVVDSLASSGKALVKRVSKNFSRTSLRDEPPDIPQCELDNLAALTQRRARIDSLAEQGSSTATIAHIAYLDTATLSIVNEIMTFSKDAGETSVEASRALEIVELIVTRAAHAKESDKAAVKLAKSKREAIDCRKIGEQFTRLVGEAAEKAKQWAQKAQEHEVNAKDASEMADTAMSEVGAWTRKEQEIRREMEKAEEELEKALEVEWQDEKLRELIERIKTGREEKEGRLTLKRRKLDEGCTIRFDYGWAGQRLLTREEEAGKQRPSSQHRIPVI